jgi:membrane protease YdiL (CAAX protease family)
MNSVGIFIEDDRLRPIWRFFVSATLIVLAILVNGALLGTAVRALGLQLSFQVAALGQSILDLLAILALFKLMTTVFEGRPLGSVGMAFHPRWWKELGLGLGLGAAMLILAVLPEWSGGFAHFTFAPHPTLGPGCFAFVLFAVAATNEEAVFRGYPFQRLVESIKPLGAIAVTSALFGLVHLSNPNRTWISTLNTALIGIPFCIAYLRTRALWVPIGMHFIWNFLQGFLFGLPVSGLTVSASVLAARVRGPVGVTGGGYGPEASWPATIAILVGTMYLAFAKSIYTTEEMRVLALAPVAAPWPEPPITIFSPAPPDEDKKD